MVDTLTEQIAKGGKVLNEVFTKDRTHAQLVQRSEPLLRLLMRYGVLGQGDRALVWEASEINEGELRVELFKVLIGAAADMRGEDRKYFLG